MKTIRLLYPDHVSGGLDTYYFGANILAHILPENNNQPMYRVNITPPGEETYETTDGIYAKEEVVNGIKDAQKILKETEPDKIITIGGNCMVSLAPFDYLNGRYENTGIIWIDAHPDVTTSEIDYPYAHAKVLSALMGEGNPELSELMSNEKFEPEQILYVGLQGLHDYQKEFLETHKVDYKIQTEAFVSNETIKNFLSRYNNILIHLDIDVLDPSLFHSTYFANPELVGDGSSGGKMTIEELGRILNIISVNSNIVGFSIAEYLPFDEYKFHKMLCNLKLFTE